ncbi:phosphate ABC transporter membrane protein 2 (PhoT family) [Tamaricihabitans halophyticus]|uniref:Phosphate transport system permease protein PstA n=1 Tax=Tamaricihabitans halophyticus TaxID=1262583 RepID=A0A4R2QXB1_9PSEU|nr:phosphate ABC transporter permease PstA [Tamaricihabitans halophyticus]TCP54367.1 phosphate ABC transporter membrane protein 2 (PhoT family) [Tamaricihabitans halophyticus]
MTTTDSLVDRPATSPAFQPISGGRKTKNLFATVLVTLAFLLALVPLGWLLVTVVVNGFEAITTSTWWSHSLKGVMPDEVNGGVYHAIYGSVIQSLICAIIAVPVGIFTAIYLVEYGRGKLAKTVTFMVDILSGVPSIVAALFIFALWITAFGFPKSALAVSFALVLLMLPVVVRSTEEMLRLVPDQLREASYALGVPKWKTIVRVVLPTAMSGMVTGVMLAIARVMGETAPVLVLVGYSRSINFDAFDGNMASLPLLIMNELMNPEAAGQLRVWGAALTLILLVMLFNLVAALVSRFSAVRSK